VTRSCRWVLHSFEGKKLKYTVVGNADIIITATEIKIVLGSHFEQMKR
jgi:hypothetical protein